MAPRRPSAQEAADAGTPARSGAGSEEERAGSWACSPVTPAGATRVLDDGSEGGGERGQTPSASPGEASAPPAVESGDADKLQAALAELQAASSARDEASAVRREAVAERQAGAQPGPTVKRASDYAELRLEVAWLRKAEAQHRRFSELLELVSESERLAAAQQSHVLGVEVPPPPPHALVGSGACAEALEAAQESASALAQDTSERLHEVERLCSVVTKRARRSKEHTLAQGAEMSELRVRLEEEAEQMARALGGEEEAQGQAAAARQQERTELEANVEVRQQLQELECLQTASATTEELEAARAEVRLRDAEVTSSVDKAEQLTADLEVAQRICSSSQERAQAEQWEARRLKQELHQLRCELATEGASCKCNALPGEAQWAPSHSLPPHPHGVVNGHVVARTDVTKQLPVRVGVSTLAELLVLIFGDLKRPLAASDLKVFTADALASLTCGGHNGLHDGLCDSGAERGGLRWAEEVPMSDSESAAVEELDQTMEWLMTADGGQEELTARQNASSFADGRDVLERPSTHEADERSSRRKVLEDANEGSKLLDWNVDGASPDFADPMQLMGSVLDKLASAKESLLESSAEGRRGDGASAHCGAELGVGAPVRLDAEAVACAAHGTEARPPVASDDEAVDGTPCGKEEQEGMSADTGVGLEGAAPLGPDAEASDGGPGGREEAADGEPPRDVEERAASGEVVEIAEAPEPETAERIAQAARAPAAEATGASAQRAEALGEPQKEDGGAQAAEAPEPQTAETSAQAAEAPDAAAAEASARPAEALEEPQTAETSAQAAEAPEPEAAERIGQVAEAAAPESAQMSARDAEAQELEGAGKNGQVAEAPEHSTAETAARAAQALGPQDAEAGARAAEAAELATAARIGPVAEAPAPETAERAPEAPEQIAQAAEAPEPRSTERSAEPAEAAERSAQAAEAPEPEAQIAERSARPAEVPEPQTAERSAQPAEAPEPRTMASTAQAAEAPEPNAEERGGQAAGAPGPEAVERTARAAEAPEPGTTDSIAQAAEAPEPKTTERSDQAAEAPGPEASDGTVVVAEPPEPQAMAKAGQAAETPEPQTEERSGRAAEALEPQATEKIAQAAEAPAPRTTERIAQAPRADDESASEDDSEDEASSSDSPADGRRGSERRASPSPAAPSQESAPRQDQAAARDPREGDSSSDEDDSDSERDGAADGGAEAAQARERGKETAGPAPRAEGKSCSEGRGEDSDEEEAAPSGASNASAKTPEEGAPRRSEQQTLSPEAQAVQQAQAAVHLLLQEDLSSSDSESEPDGAPPELPSRTPAPEPEGNNMFDYEDLGEFPPTGSARILEAKDVAATEEASTAVPEEVAEAGHADAGELEKPAAAEEASTPSAPGEAAVAGAREQVEKSEAAAAGESATNQPSEKTASAEPAAKQWTPKTPKTPTAPQDPSSATATAPELQVSAARKANGPPESSAVPETSPPDAKPPPPAVVAGQLWRVVGGVDFGGIRVREGQATNTPFLEERLSTGALVRELELQGERLCYQKVEGEGPDTGWVTVLVLPDKELLVRFETPCDEAAKQEQAAEDATSVEEETAAAGGVTTQVQVWEAFEAYQKQYLGNPFKEAFNAALKLRDVRVLRRLILQKAPVDMADDMGKTALIKAVRWMSEPMCKLLLAFSANPDWPPQVGPSGQRQQSAVDAAAALKKDRPNSPIPALFEPGRARKLRQDAFHDAALAGEEDVIQVLAANGRWDEQTYAEVKEDLCSHDDDGWTPLHLCILAGSNTKHTRVISVLLKERASVDALDSRGETPLMLAVRRAKDMLVCHYLLDARADVWYQSPIGETALDLVDQAGSQRDEVFQALMDRATQEWWSEAERTVLRSEPRQQELPQVRTPRLHLPLQPFSGTWPKVSVLCPTVPSRSQFHRQVYQCFKEQIYPDKELVVVDSGPESSSFFNSGPASGDPNMVYRWRKDHDKYDPKHPEGGHGMLSVGAKRNIGIRAATGSIIVHFDDDDFYGPGYLVQMVSLLLRHGADAVKLSSFFVFDCQSGRLGYCDPESERRHKDDVSVDEFILGYGFSYVYRKDLAEKKPFPSLHFGEDYAFIEGLQKDGYSVCLWPDLDGICLHMQHGRNTSLAFCSDNVPRCFFPSMEVFGCALLHEALEQWPEGLGAPADDPGRAQVVPGSGQRLRRSAMLGLALKVIECRKRLAARGSTGLPPAGVGLAVAEARALLGHRSFDSASPALQLHRSLRLEIEDEMGASKHTLMVPWCATVSDARDIAIEALRARTDSRLVLRDALRDLEDTQLVLGRRSLHYAFE